ncbi:MAG: circularly permuted type 2 ATP-grasp protein [Afipia sp.]
MAVAFDEMNGPDGALRPAYDELGRWLSETPPDTLDYRRKEAELLFRRIGITFAVYGEAESTERLIPFDVIPRILSGGEWTRLEAGLKQRVRALNLFLRDIYHERDILRAQIIPSDLIFQNPVFRPEMNGQRVPHDVYVHIAGIDVVRTDPNEFFVLEDNARTPSGVSYMLENREIMMRLFPDLFSRHRVAPVENYPDELLAALRSVAPLAAKTEPTVALLTPGVYNSAYYEHSFLADKLGVELVEGRDLVVNNNEVLMRTTEGLKRVDVIYRRVDDDFIDPLTFRPDSVLGVPGLMSAYMAGNVTLANAVGTGIADDKAVYSYMPEIVRFYLGEEPILKNVPTWRCREADDLAYVLDNLHELVVKEVHGSGGYGMLIGPAATKDAIENFRARLKRAPDGFIAQPTLALSTCPTCTEKGLAPRHVDLRPFVLTGRDHVTVVPGGLTRVALKEGSLVVNSSQGGGTKDPWILDDEPVAEPDLFSVAARGR